MTIGGFSSLQGEQLIQKPSADELMEELTVAVAPAAGSCICSQSASTLINSSGSDLSGRKTLVITNPSDVDTVIVGPQSTDEIYKRGYRIRPGKSLKISFTGSSYAIYGRTDGALVEVEVFEC